MRLGGSNKSSGITRLGLARFGIAGVRLADYFALASRPDLENQGADAAGRLVGEGSRACAADGCAFQLLLVSLGGIAWPFKVQ